MAFGFARVTHFFRSANLESQIGYDVLATPPQEDLQDAAVELHLRFTNEWRKSASVSWSCDRTRVVANGEERWRYLERAGTENGLGTTAGVSLLVSKIPALPPQGRLYIPGLTTQSVDTDGRLFPSNVTTWQTRMDAWMNAIGQQGFIMVMIRPDESWAAVGNLVVKPYVGRQDRRLQRART